MVTDIYVIGFVDYHRIVELYKDWTGLYSLLVPIILPLNVLTGLQRIVGGFRIALGLLGLQSELNCNIYSSSHPFAQFLFHWITSDGLAWAFSIGMIDCSSCAIGLFTGRD